MDFSAAETLRAMFGVLEDNGILLVVARVMDDIGEVSRYHLDELFGKDAFYETLEEVVHAYRQETRQGWR